MVTPLKERAMLRSDRFLNWVAQFLLELAAIQRHPKLNQGRHPKQSPLAVTWKDQFAEGAWDLAVSTQVQ